MKTELPERSKGHGAAIFKTRDAILEKHRDKIAFIILFGSFARGDWVYDKYYVDHILYEFASDYDFLIITKTPRQGSGHGATNLESDIGGLLDKRNFYLNHTPTFVIEPLDRVNKDLEKGKYFFSDLVKEGILLYDSGEFTLSEKKILSNEEIKEMAVEDYEQWFTSGEEFLIDCRNASLRKSYNKSAFYLHQATENFLNCSLLVLTGYKPKSHDIEKLLKLCSAKSNDFLSIFPRADKEQKDRFELLKAAYVEARYDKNYRITEDELRYLISRVELLLALTERVCRERIGSL